MSQPPGGPAVADPPVRWGFLGAGAIAAGSLAPAVHAADGAVLQAAAARDPARAAALGPAGAAAGDYAAVCEDPAVDAVYVALANDAHLPWTLRALAAGKHVLCEKPLGLSAAEVDEIATAARAAGLLAVEAMWSRWHPRTRRAEALVRDGVLGAGPREVTATFTFDGVAAGNYRLAAAHGGGALYDVGCYAVAAAHWALDAPSTPLEVLAAAAEVGPTGVDLTTTATLAGPAGRAVVRASMAAPPRQELRVAAGAASLELVELPFTAGAAPSALRVRDAAGERVERFAAVDPYRLMVEAVSAGIRGAADAWVLPLAESAALARTLDAVRAAAGAP